MAFFFSSRRRHTRYIGDWSSDVCSSDLQRKAISDSPCLLLVEKPLQALHGTDRKSVVKGKSVELGGRRNIKKKKKMRKIRYDIEAANNRVMRQAQSVGRLIKEYSRCVTD